MTQATNIDELNKEFDRLEKLNVPRAKGKLKIQAGLMRLNREILAANLAERRKASTT
jgi:hypothetical protein